MKKSIKFLVILSAILGLGVANLSAHPLEAKTAVGIYGMSTTETNNASAYGLELQQWFTPKLAVTVLGSAFYQDNEWYSRPFNANVSLQLTYSLIESQFGNHFGSRFFAYALGGYSGYGENVKSNDAKAENKIVYSHNALVSLGFGFEFLMFDHLSIPLTFGFAGEFPNDPAAGFCLGAGVRYAF